MNSRGEVSRQEKTTGKALRVVIVLENNKEGNEEWEEGLFFGEPAIAA